MFRIALASSNEAEGLTLNGENQGSVSVCVLCVDVDPRKRDQLPRLRLTT